MRSAFFVIFSLYNLDPFGSTFNHDILLILTVIMSLVKVFLVEVIYYYWLFACFGGIVEIWNEIRGFVDWLMVVDWDLLFGVSCCESDVAVLSLWNSPLAWLLLDLGLAEDVLSLLQNPIKKTRTILVI